MPKTSVRQLNYQFDHAGRARRRYFVDGFELTDNLRVPWILASLRRSVSRLNGFSSIPSFNCENSDMKSWKWLGGRPLINRIDVSLKRVPWRQPCCIRDELRTVHARHVVVNDDHFRRRRRCDQLLQGDFGIAVGLRAMAKVFEQAAKASRTRSSRR